MRLKLGAMELFPEEGLKVSDAIGAGGNGNVFRAEGAEGRKFALKIFEAGRTDGAMLRRYCSRLEAGGWPEGVVPLVSADLEDEPAYWLMPLYGAEETAGFRQASLQREISDHPGARTREVICGISRALGEMHARKLAHGNLKPGNVFFDSAENLKLADWAVGNVSPDHPAEFTDAMLYQPPEQLENPAGLETAVGLKWDVYAFGALAFRLLTGKFPRCDDAFSAVAPPPEATRKEGVHADLRKIAANLRTQAEIEWPEGAGDENLRRWIGKCLALDPAARPADMCEVSAGLENAEAELAAVVPSTPTDDFDETEERSETGKSGSRAVFFALGVAAVAAVVMAGLWRLSSSQLKSVLASTAAEKSAHAEALARAGKSIAAAEERAENAEQALDYQKELAMARLESSRLIGDRLFEWAMEKGRRSLPTLEGRESRLRQLERYFQDFLLRTSREPVLEDERRRVKLQLAEVSLATGETELAEKRLAEAMDAWKDHPMDGELRMRVATDSLLLALLRYDRGEAAAVQGFQEARKQLAGLGGNGIDSHRRDQLLAILDYHEARLFAVRGEDAKALEQLMRATQALRKLSAERPDAAVLRSELAACHLSSATILEGMGNLGDAREVRNLASAELVKLIAENPQDVNLRLDLAGCYGAIAETAVLAGDVASADQMGQAAMKVVDGILLEQPDNASARAIKAAQLGLRAGLRRDRGEAAEASKDLDDGIRLLEGMHAAAPAQAFVSYRLALLLWQKARMAGFSGKRGEETQLLRRSWEMMGKLEGNRSADGPRDEQVRLAAAYILGDLGHSLQISDRRDEARRTFEDAEKTWEALLSSRPHSEEYAEGLSWCKQRAADLKEGKK